MKRATIVIALLSLSLTTHVFACKLTGEMAASRMRVKAILEHLGLDDKDRDRTIVNITQVEGALSGKYSVETKDEKSCEVSTYVTKIHPSCAVEIRRLEKVPCQK